MPKKDEDDWIEDLIVLGIGALAGYFLYKVATTKNREEIHRCPYCGVEIRKWAVECPNCRRKIRGL